jgi:hypothetical protein
LHKRVCEPDERGCSQAAKERNTQGAGLKYIQKLRGDLHSLPGIVAVRWVPGLSSDLLRLQAVDLRRHDEVAFSQPVNLMRPQGDFGLSPRQQNVGMMSLLLR